MSISTNEYREKLLQDQQAKLQASVKKQRQADQNSLFFILTGIGQLIFALLCFVSVEIGTNNSASIFRMLDLFLGFTFLVPAFITLANGIGLPIYIAVQKPRGKALVLSILSFLFTIGFVIYFVNRS